MSKNSDDEKKWQKILEIVKKHEVPSSLLGNLEELIKTREELTTKLRKFSEDIRNQEIAVSSVKTAGAVTTVAGTILMFTPLFPLGAGITVSSTAALAATSLGDWIAEEVKGSKLDKMLKKDQELAELVINDMKKIDILCEDFLRNKLVVSRQEGYGLAIGITVFIKSLGTTALTMITLYKPMKDLFVNGVIRYSGGELKASLGFISRSVGVFTSIVAVADCIISWLSTKPCRKTADEAKQLIDDSMPQLKALKEVVSRLKDEVKKHHG